MSKINEDSILNCFSFTIIILLVIGSVALVCLAINKLSELL